MANLETLEITINANAESASQGLSNLINSLSALSKQVGKSVGGLKLLNKELSTLKGFSNIKFTGIEKAAKDIKNAVDIPESKLDALEMKLEGVTEAMEKAAGKGNKLSVANKRLQQFSIENQIKKETEAIKAQTESVKEQALTISHYQDDVIWDEQKQREMNPQWFVDYDSPEGKAMIAARNEALKKRGNALPIASDESTLDQFKNVKKEAQEAQQATPVFERLKKVFNSFREGSKNLGKELKSIIPKFKTLHKVMRIASTMLIRTGIRTLFKGISEGIGNYYQYSKGIGSEFANVADKLSSSWSTLKNQMGAAIAPALTAAIPVINSLASAATTAFNALSQLFALLTGKSSWSKATSQVKAFDAAASKAGGGGGGLNELLGKFDELNVITSEGGGGGGGGGVADEYSTMFEEMYEFDNKIRDIANFIKDTISWVKENFDVLLVTAGLIGTAILGWKLSKAFEGFMSTLGSWIAGGAMIAIGVVLDYDFGYKAGSAMNGGESLKFGDIVEGVAGIIAAGIGGYVIGGGVGAAVGIGIAITATISGIYMGYLDQQDKNKWGNVKLTASEIQDYVNKQFKFNVKAEIQLLEAKIANARAAKSHLNGEIRDFSRSLDKVKLSIDSDSFADDVQKAVDKAEETINAFQAYLNETSGLFDTLFEINPSEVSEQIKKDIDEADTLFSQYVQAEGKKIADLYDKGMSSGWKENEQKQIYDLLSHLEGIFQATEADQAYNHFLSSSKLKLKDFTRDTAKEILNAQKQAFSDYEKALADATQLGYEAILDRAAYAEKMGMPEVAKMLREDAQMLIDTFQSNSSKRLASARETMKQDWINQLKAVYGIDYTNHTNTYANQFVSALRTSFNISKEEGKKRIIEYLNYITDVGITKEAKELFGITGWDLLERDSRLKFFTVVYQAVGVDAVKALKDALKLSASELFSISWTGFETKQKLEFYNAVKNAYGSYNALKAAKDAGIDIGNAVKEGLASTDSSTRQAAEQIVKDIQAELDKLGIKINASAEFEVAITALIEYEVKENIKPGTTTKSVKAGSTSSSLKPNKTNISMTKATGAYGIPAGDVFIANEQGAELVGSINGKTSVANQEQIVEGIQRGVAEANNEQNMLLRQQNELLRGILEKENIVKFGASASFGRTVQQSLNMYSGKVGG